LVDILSKRQYNKHMNNTKLNELIQWIGTLFVLLMYALMNLAPELAPWNLVAGLLGSICYFVWTIRVKNRPQLLINIVALTLCVAGLIKYANS
jgi:O-antigen/teichoic acid export membrane protein